MNEKLNLVEVLKDCPKGMELDCAMFDDVTFIGVEKKHKPISIRSGEIYYYLTEFGTWSYDENAKCIIFPKGKTTWEGFQRPFKDGDILYIDCNDDENTNEQYQYTFILKEISDGKICCYCYIDEANIHKEFEICLLADMRYNPRLATEEEKQRLFDAIKANGYKWNEETKRLEKLIATKFNDKDKIHLWTLQDAKEGDVLAINWYEGYDYWEKIVIFKKYHNEGATSPCVEGYGNTFKNRELVFNEEVPFFSKTWTSCLEPATKDQRDFLFQKIKEAGYKWNADEKKLEKMIVPKFKVGDKIKEKNERFPSTRTIVGYNECIGYNTSIHDWVRIEDQDNWELVPDEITALKPKFKVGDRIKEKGSYICGIIKCIDIDNFYKVEYSGGGVSFVNVKYQNKYELVPDKFDPKTLQPFDKVLVKDSIGIRWNIQFFEAMHEWNKNFPFKCVGGKEYSFCIPYNDDTKYLVGKSEEAPEFYRYWED